jgi:hypothetical protein
METIFQEKVYQPAAVGIGPYDFGWVSKCYYEQVKDTIC